MKRQKERDTVELKRIWVKVTKETHKELQHLSIDLDRTIEVMAGELLADAIRRARDELVRKGRQKPASGQ